MDKIQTVVHRLKDNRSRKVIFLSHCIPNENTRYLGGACRRGCVQEIIECCIDNDWGMVQMPCPEQHAWGGIIKRLLLIAYGSKGTFFYRFRHIFLPLFLLYTRLRYRRLARETANQIADYLGVGFSIVGIVGIDGSPSCGVNTTLDFWKSFDLIANMDVESATADNMNAIVRQCLIDGKGIFTVMLQEELQKRHVDVPHVAHDLIAELDGKQSNLLEMFRHTI